MSGVKARLHQALRRATSVAGSKGGGPDAGPLSDEEIDFAFRLVLGRPAGGGSALDSKRGQAATELISGLFLSSEFRDRVLPAVEGFAIFPHQNFGAAPDGGFRKKVAALLIDTTDELGAVLNAKSWRTLIVSLANIPAVRTSLEGPESHWLDHPISVEESVATPFDVNMAFRLLLGRSAPEKVRAERSGADRVDNLLQILASDEFAERIYARLRDGAQIPHEKQGEPDPGPQVISWIEDVFSCSADIRVECTWRELLSALLSAERPLGRIVHEARRRGVAWAFKLGGLVTDEAGAGLLARPDAMVGLRAQALIYSLFGLPPPAQQAPEMTAGRLASRVVADADVARNTIRPLLHGRRPGHLSDNGLQGGDAKILAALLGEASGPFGSDWSSIVLRILRSRAFEVAGERMAGINPVSWYVVEATNYLTAAARKSAVASAVVGYRDLESGKLALRANSSMSGKSLTLEVNTDHGPRRLSVELDEIGRAWLPELASPSADSLSPNGKIIASGVVRRADQAETRPFPFVILPGDAEIADEVEPRINLQIVDGLLKVEAIEQPAGERFRLKLDDEPTGWEFTTVGAGREVVWADLTLASARAGARIIGVFNAAGRRVAELDGEVGTRAWRAGEPRIHEGRIVGWFWAPTASNRAEAVLLCPGVEGFPDEIVERSDLLDGREDLPVLLGECAKGYEFALVADVFDSNVTCWRIGFALSGAVSVVCDFELVWTPEAFKLALLAMPQPRQKNVLRHAATAGRTDLIAPLLEHVLFEGLAATERAGLLALLLQSAKPGAEQVDEIRSRYDQLWAEIRGDKDADVAGLYHAVIDAAKRAPSTFERRVFPGKPSNEAMLDFVLARADANQATVDEMADAISLINAVKRWPIADAVLGRASRRHPANHRILATQANRFCDQGAFVSAEQSAAAALKSKSNSSPARTIFDRLASLRGDWKTMFALRRGDGADLRWPVPEFLRRPALTLGMFSFALTGNAGANFGDDAADLARKAQVTLSPAREAFKYSVFFLDDKRKMADVSDRFTALQPQCVQFSYCRGRELHAAPALGAYAIFFRTLGRATPETIRHLLDQIEQATVFAKIYVATAESRQLNEGDLAGFVIRRDVLSKLPLTDFRSAVDRLDRVWKTQDLVI